MRAVGWFLGGFFVALVVCSLSWQILAETAILDRWYRSKWDPWIGSASPVELLAYEYLPEARVHCMLWGAPGLKDAKMVAFAMAKAEIAAWRDR